jgi:KipI family sensor histidine kinase inhibitor
LSADPRPEIRIRPVGDAALTVELGDAIDPALSARVRALDRALRARPFPGYVESVPTHCALLVCFDPERVSFEEGEAALRALGSEDPSGEEGGRLHVIPVLYGGEDGPDLEAVALRARLSPAEVIALHAGTEYTAFMLGFLPVFAYLGLVPDALDTPRLLTPRTRVPAGSVGIAGRLTGIYPTAAPGGWNLLGRTTRRVFDPGREPPSLFEPGDRVRFVSVERLEEEPATPPPALPTGPASLEVVSAGFLTTVQDRGRPGLRRYGVPTAGPVDEAAHARANVAVGNPREAAALECTLLGPTLRFLAPTRFALGGADLGARLERDDLGPWPVPEGMSVLARAGNVLTFEGRGSGCRAYLAFAGGIDVPVVLGSRSTDLASGFGGFGGRPLRAGDRLSLLPARDSGRREETTAAEPIGDEGASVRVILGPQDDRFTPEAVEQFLTSSWSVRATSDRTGLRLEGPRLLHRGPAEIPSDGMVPGCVQVPPDGQPIVMLADGPTTGGYPKIATVVRADLGRLGQLVPGVGRVRFRPQNATR